MKNDNKTITYQELHNILRKHFRKIQDYYIEFLDCKKASANTKVSRQRAIIKNSKTRRAKKEYISKMEYYCLQMFLQSKK